MNKIYVPWTEKQIDALEKYQENQYVHPYTCLCGYSLVPTVDGWECEECSYTQEWFYEESLDMVDYKPDWIGE